MTVSPVLEESSPNGSLRVTGSGGILPERIPRGGPPCYFFFRSTSQRLQSSAVTKFVPSSLFSAQIAFGVTVVHSTSAAIVNGQTL